jgi:uncharacterized protein (DUF433 family)
MYLPSEVASYLRAASPTSTLVPTSRQVYGWIRRGLLAPGFRNAPQDSIVIDFDDLIAGQAISLLRAAGVPLGAIVRAAEFFADLYGVDRPYAHRQFWISGHDIFGKQGDVLIAGSRGGQLALPLLVDRPRSITTSLVFDTRTSRPISWSPRGHVELRPTRQSGQPCVRGTSILTISVWRYARGSDTPGQIAWRLGIDQADVEGALAWEHARVYRHSGVA